MKTIVLGGKEVVSVHDDFQSELRAIRESVGLTAQPHVVALRVVGQDAYDVLKFIVPADLTLRTGKARHTVLLNDAAHPIADVYVCADEGAYLLLAEGLAAADLLAHLSSQIPERARVQIEDLSQTHTVLSLNGPFAWEVLAALEGAETIGFPYLTFFRSKLERICLRAGKTGEFGYDLLVRREDESALWTRILELGAETGLLAVGVDALWRAGLENWFYNPYRQRGVDLTPLELQLQWRVSSKKDFVGARALQARRAAGGGGRATAIRSAELLEAGDEVTLEGERIGYVLDAGWSPTLAEHIGIAIVDETYAHSGIDCYRAHGHALRTASPPFVNNRSLYVNPRKHSYRTRDEIAVSPART